VGLVHSGGNVIEEMDRARSIEVPGSQTIVMDKHIPPMGSLYAVTPGLEGLDALPEGYPAQAQLPGHYLP
jgi:hypothetical protein